MSQGTSPKFGPRIGLWIGDSFAEIIGTSEKNEIIEESRWLLSKQTPDEALRRVLKQLISTAETPAKSGTIFISTARAESQNATRRLNPQVALLVTSGFEQALEMNGTRANLEHVFGVDERIRADGSIEKPLRIEDLEFIASKLELTEIKDVALGLMHARKNPDHEKRAEHFFTERGFRVNCSHRLNTTGLDSWLKAASLGTHGSVVAEDFALMQKVITEETADGANGKWTVHVWGANGLTERDLTQPLTGEQTYAGVEKSLTAFAASFDKTGVQYVLHLGLEAFHLMKKSDGWKASELEVQPTLQIGASSWFFPAWTQDDRGYEPGPMLFGKSHQLTLLDILFLRGRLKDVSIEAFTDRVSEKSRSRILESLFTLGKKLVEPGRSTVDTTLMTEDIERVSIERLLTALAFPAGTVINVMGPLAPVLLPLFRERRSDLKMQNDADLKATLATAACSGANT